MGKKVQPVNILPPPSSSDDETENEEGNSTDDEQHNHPQQPQQPQESEESDDETEDDENGPEPVVKKPSLPQPQESEESDDDSDDSPCASAFTVKPIVSKSPQPKKPVSKTTRVKSRAKRPAESEEIDKASKPVLINQEPVKVKGGNSKRPAEIEPEKSDKVSKNKKSKVSNGDGQSVGKVDKGSKSKKMGSWDEEGGEAEEKKSVVKWSEKDEIALLVGIIDRKAEMGDDVNSKMDAFYGYVKDLLSINLTKSQFSEKIKRLKKKFQTNDEKCQNGEEPVFSRPHENKLFELSLKIWGSEANDSKVKSSMNKDKKDGIVVATTSTPLKSPANKKGGIVAGDTSTPIKSVTNRELFVQEEVKDTIMEDKKEEKRDFWSLYPQLCASLESEAAGFFLTPRVGDSKEYVNEMISGMGGEKARELEDDWKAISVMHRQMYARRAHLIKKQAEAVLDSQIFYN